jgi:hypothetical protein
MVATLKMPMRLVADSGAERRMFPRREANGHVQGVRLDHSITAHRQPQLSLMLRDISLGGISAITRTPLQRGERLSVFFPPQGSRRAWDAYGRVVRCDPSAMGYRIALEFDPLPAA